jgi:hypothetical protein
MRKKPSFWATRASSRAHTDCCAAQPPGRAVPQAPTSCYYGHYSPDPHAKCTPGAKRTCTSARMGKTAAQPAAAALRHAVHCGHAPRVTGPEPTRPWSDGRHVAVADHWAACSPGSLPGGRPGGQALAQVHLGRRREHLRCGEPGHSFARVPEWAAVRIGTQPTGCVG